MNNKKYLFIVDSYSWALNKRALNLKKFLNLNADIIHFNKCNNINFNNYDVVYSLNWPIYGYIRDNLKERKFKLVTTISSHEENRPILIKDILKQHDKFSVSNIHLYNEYKKYYKNVYFTPFGVDESVYLKKTNPNDYRNIVGFVGNIDRKEKRFNLIKDTILSLKNIELITATNYDLFNENEMVNFYNKIGTLICFSTSEGTPNPILEAAACGRNIITSNVGNISQLFPKYLLDNNIINSKDCIKNKLNNIIKNNNIDLEYNGNLLKNEILKNWSWSIKSKNFYNLLVE